MEDLKQRAGKLEVWASEHLAKAAAYGRQRDTAVQMRGTEPWPALDALIEDAADKAERESFTAQLMQADADRIYRLLAVPLAPPGGGDGVGGSDA